MGPGGRPPERVLRPAPRIESIASQLVTEAFEYDGGRPVTVYLPRDPPQGIVFAGDGQLISRWGGELETAGVPATMIVGAHRLDDETLRLQEYSPGFEPWRFAAHEQFFVKESADGSGRALELCCLPSTPRCSVCPQAESWRSPSRSATQARTLSWSNGSGRTAPTSGEKSSL